MQSITTKETAMKTTATHLYVKAISITATLASLAALVGCVRGH